MGLPQYTGDGSTESNEAPVESTENTETSREASDASTAEGTPTTEQAADLVDLSKYSRVKLGDRELTREELEKGIMFQSDYTKKTQEMAQDRRYFDNLQADLGKVAGNPSLAAEFKRIYPEKFHGYLNYVMQKTNSAQPTNSNAAPNTQTTINDPRIDKIFQTVESLEKERLEEKIAQRQTEIDSAFAKYQSKYPLSTPNGDESYVITKAQALLEKGEKLDDKTWEKIFKDSHTHYENAYQAYYKQKFTKQSAAHEKGKDMAAGGGVPGGSPRAARTIKDATKLAMEDLSTR